MASHLYFGGQVHQNEIKVVQLRLVERALPIFGKEDIIAFPLCCYHSLLRSLKFRVGGLGTHHFGDT